jgi:two-component system sensor histidine kinase PilS (NtrC family)
MTVQRTPPEQHSWFSTVSLPLASPAPPSAPAYQVANETFARMWAGFMSARIIIALAVLSLYLTLSAVRPTRSWLLALCLAYLAVTLLVRLLARPHGPGRPFDAQWLYAVGVDLAFIIALQSQQPAGIDYTPLLALPVLIAAVLGSRQLALGTSALATLALLGHTAWNAGSASWNSAADVARASFAGAGLVLLSLLTNHLSTRLAREQALALRSRAETRMQALVNSLVIEALPDGVLVVDADCAVRAANPAAHLMLTAGDEVTPELLSLHDNPAWAPLVDVVRRTFADGPLDAVELTLHDDNRHGSHLWARTQRTPSVGGSRGGLCVMFLRDLREMEARLRTEKLAAMGRMSAAVAHEIRNPLAAISQANDLLEEDLTAPAQQRLTAMVRQNAQRLGNIVDDVLNVVRVQNTADPQDAPALPLDEQVQACCREWRLQHEVGARLKIELRAPGIQVRFARDHLRRVLVNLLDNAARHASPQASAIQLSTQASRHGPVTLMVWSDGAPLEASVRRHLFEPFFSSEARSSGLGLFICRELCERHGAVIGHERAQREQAGGAVDGNEFFVSFRRAHGAPSAPHLEDTHRP